MQGQGQAASALRTATAFRGSEARRVETAPALSAREKIHLVPPSSGPDSGPKSGSPAGDRDRPIEERPGESGQAASGPYSRFGDVLNRRPQTTRSGVSRLGWPDVGGRSSKRAVYGNNCGKLAQRSSLFARVRRPRTALPRAYRATVGALPVGLLPPSLPLVWPYWREGEKGFYARHLSS